jgi:hypothetical protein
MNQQRPRIAKRPVAIRMNGVRWQGDVVVSLKGALIVWNDLDGCWGDERYSAMLHTYVGIPQPSSPPSRQ